MDGKSIRLSETERKVMRYIWSVRGPVMVSDIMEYFAREYQKHYAASTVNTMLQRLIKKGYLAQGDKYIAFSGYEYHWVISEEEYQRRQLSRYRDIDFEGSAGDLIVALLQTQDISEQERIKIRECIDQLKAKEDR